MLAGGGGGELGGVVFAPDASDVELVVEQPDMVPATAPPKTSN